MPDHFEEQRYFNLVNRSSWLDWDNSQDPPWKDEPDEVLFVCLNYYCAIMRNHLGALCGYAAVPLEHPWFGLNANNALTLTLHAHGGITFCGYIEPVKIYIAEPSNHLWWFGFDCAHYQDLVPAFITRGMSRTYKNEAFVRKECEGVVQQIITAEIRYK